MACICADGTAISPDLIYEKTAKGPARKTAQRLSKASVIAKKKGMDRGIKKIRKTTAQKAIRKRAPGGGRCATVNVVVEQPPSLPVARLGAYIADEQKMRKGMYCV